MQILSASQETGSDGRPADPGDVWIVVAAFNEVEVIRSVVETLQGVDYRIVVVDDASTDGTGGQLRGTRAHVCHHAVNLGQGAALQTGIRYALMHGARYIVTFDADGQHRADDVPRLLEPLLDGQCDVVLGSRFTGDGRAVDIPAAKQLVLRLATIYTRFTVGIRVTDTHNGLRAFSCAAAEKLDITQNRMAHATEMLKLIRRHRLRFVEVPVVVYYTDYSLGKGQKIRNAFNIVWDCFTELFRRCA